MAAHFNDFSAARQAVARFLAGSGLGAGELEHIELPVEKAPGEGAPEPPQAPLVSLLSALLTTLQAKEREAHDHKRRADEAHAQAHRDALTGLANRAAWNRALSREERRCRRYGRSAAVVLADLDELKATNDASGHRAGDALLRRAARTLVACTRRPDVVARLGGDEFAILALDCEAADLPALERRVRGALQAAGVRASVGAALRSDEDGLSGAVVHADQAMYREKGRKRH